MGLFSQPTPQPSAPRESKYSVEKVQTLLEKLGPMRLRVTDPRVKVLISQITWGTLPYLNALNGGKPGSAELADVMSTLDMLIQTLEGYIQIQDNPASVASRDDPQLLLAKGQRALEVHWQKISAGSPTTAADLSGYNALTGFLTSGASPA